MDDPFFNSNEIIIDLKIKKPNKYIVLLISILTVAILGITDYISGFEMSFSIFYLLPISFTILLSDFKLGIIISLLSAFSWYLADISSGHIYNSLFTPIWNSVMRFGYFMIHTYFFSQFIKLYEKTKINSLTDSLTGIANTRYFMEFFEREIKKAKRTNLPFTLLYIDLDNFKFINDTYGHQVGDSLLKMIAKTVNGSIRPSDIFARLGGDEFAILLPESDYSESNNLIKRIKKTIETELKKNNWPITVSIGAITYKNFENTISEMIKQADDFMYKVKKDGKNNIEHSLFE